MVGVLLAVAAFVLLIDQATKIWAVTNLDDGRVIEVVGDILTFRLIRNPGAAFSFFTDMTVVLTIAAAAVVIVILRVSRRLTSRPWAVALGGFLGGALGNLTDRLFREPAPFHGHVVDFLVLPNWPVFNLADSAIVGAAVLVAVLSFRGVPYDGGVSPDRESGPAADDAPSDAGPDPAGPAGSAGRDDADPAGTAERAGTTDHDDADDRERADAERDVPGSSGSPT